MLKHSIRHSGGNKFLRKACHHWLEHIAPNSEDFNLNAVEEKWEEKSDVSEIQDISEIQSIYKLETHFCL